MSLTLVQSGKAASSPSFGHTIDVAFASSVGSIRRLVIKAFSSEVRGSVSGDFAAGSCVLKVGSTATVGSITLDKTLQAFDSGASLLHRAAIWSCASTGSGSATFTITSPGGGGGDDAFYTCTYSELSDSGGSAPTIDSSASSNNGGVASSTPATSAITPSGFEAYVAAVCVFSGVGANPDTITEGGGFTLIAEEQNSTANGVGSHVRKLITSGSATPSWTLAGSRIWSAVAVAYVGTSSSASLTPRCKPTLQAVNRACRF